MSSTPTKRKTWTEQLKRAVAVFHANTGMKYTVIGRRAVNDSRLVARLEHGGITLATADELVAWLAGQGFTLTPEGDVYVKEVAKS